MQAKGASLEGSLQPASLPWVGSGSQPLALRTEEFTSPRGPRPLDVGTSAPAPALSIPYLTYPPLMSLGVLVVTWPWSLACLFPLVLYLENCLKPRTEGAALHPGGPVRGDATGVVKTERKRPVCGRVRGSEGGRPGQDGPGPQAQGRVTHLAHPCHPHTPGSPNPEGLHRVHLPRLTLPTPALDAGQTGGFCLSLHRCWSLL